MPRPSSVPARGLPGGAGASQRPAMSSETRQQLDRDAEAHIKSARSVPSSSSNLHAGAGNRVGSAAGADDLSEFAETSAYAVKR